MIRKVLLIVAVFGCGESAMTGTDGGSIEAGDFVCTSEADVARYVFAPSCTSSRCHDVDAPRASLDLQTFDVAARLDGRSSVHERCQGERLIVPGDPAASFLMRKVLGTHGPCGDAMPSRGVISPAQRRCVAGWIANLE